MRPPVPPPVPPAVPPATVVDGSTSWNVDGLQIVGRRPSRKQRNSGGLVMAVVLLLASAALVIAALTAWPTLQKPRDVVQRSTRSVEKPQPVPPSRPVPTAETKTDVKTDVPNDLPPKGGSARPARAAAAEPARPAERVGDPAMVRPEPNDSRNAAAAKTDRDPDEQANRAATEVERALRATLAALRRGDLAAARRAVDAADSAVGEDAALRSRTDRWLLLVDYAGKLETYRLQAAESAAKGREYEIDGRTIGIVELTPTSFAYKADGGTERGLRSELPRPIERAILAAWFAGDGRAANHIFLGIDRLLETRADLAAVRTEWETALRGEPATAPLMPLLDDPLLVDQPRQ